MSPASAGGGGSGFMDPTRFVFLDETATATTMTRHYGRSPSDQRLVAAVPHGHWQTTTFVAGLRQTGIVAPLVLDGPMTGVAFRAYVEQFLAPALAPGDVVVLDNLAAHKVDGVRQAVATAGASVLYLPPYSPDLAPGSQHRTTEVGAERRADRAALCQAQGPAAQSRRPHQSRTLVDHRPSARLDPAQRMRQLPRPLRLWFHLK
jgi:DDE superfamily endonuclease